MNIFNKTKWQQKLTKQDWYLSIPDLIFNLANIRNENLNEYKKIKEDIYDFFENELTEEKIPLGTEGPNWDKDRLKIDTVVIHHTSMPSGLTKERLSAVELIRLYAPYYANPSYDVDKWIKGKPIYSNHIRNGVQNFWPYHWIIRSNGMGERLLKDEEIGWHSGDWDINCRSVAIVFDDDLENKTPTEIQLKGVAHIIKTHYPGVKKEQIFGHNEINQKTICPSKLFISTEKSKGWKEELLNLI